MCELNNDLKQIGLQYKQQLISHDLQLNIHGILLLKLRLLGDNDEDFIQVIVDLDIHEFLLNHLTSCNYSINIHVLECIQQLCNYRIYYAFDYAVRTAEIILKNVFCQIQENNFEVLNLALKIIISIVENLNNFHISKQLRYDRFLNAINELLLNQTNSTVLSQTIDLFSALLSYNQFQKHVGKHALEQVNLLWEKCLKTLPKVYEDDVKLSVLTASKLCDSSLRFGTILQSLHEHHNITAFLKDVQENSLNCLKFVIIPFVAENGLTSDEIYIQFLLFLKTILQNDVAKKELRSLCEYLVENNNFVVVANYFNTSYNLVWSEEDQNMFRQLCLAILCEIMVNIEDENLYPYPIVEYKKYLYKHLEEIAKKNFKELFLCLPQESVTIDVKLCIIKYYSVYYIHSNQISELNLRHLNPFVTFLALTVCLCDIRVNFIKDLWLLFAVLFPFNTKIDDYYLYRATRNLQKLILSHKNSLSQIITYHICILRWIFWTPFVFKELKIAVIYLWLLRSQKHEVNFDQLTEVIKEKTEVAFLLLQAIRDGSAVISQLATKVLRTCLEEGNLNDSNEFSQELSKAIVYPLKEISKKVVVEKYVINSIYLLHLATCTTTPVEPNLISYSVDVFTKCVGKVGITDVLPTIFYTQAFEYVGGILAVAKTHQIQPVFSSFLNSEPMLNTLMCALISDEKEISIRASKIFYSLLEYQNEVQIKTGSKKRFKVHYLMKMLSISDEDRLQVNLQITKKLLITNQDCALNIAHPLQEDFLKGLYLRCLALVWKPGNENISNYGFKMLISILKYAHIKNLPVLNYLCNHSGNHTLILMFDKQILQNYNEDFLKFVLFWLRFSQINNEKMFNKFSIISSFWKISLVHLVNIFLNGNQLNTNYLDLSFDILKELRKFEHLLPLALKQSLDDYFKMQRDYLDK